MSEHEVTMFLARGTWSDIRFLGMTVGLARGDKPGKKYAGQQLGLDPASSVIVLLRIWRDLESERKSQWR